MLQIVQISKNNRQKREENKVENNKYTLNAPNEITTEFKVLKRKKGRHLYIWSFNGSVGNEIYSHFLFMCV